MTQRSPFGYCLRLSVVDALTILDTGCALAVPSVLTFLAKRQSFVTSGTMNKSAGSFLRLRIPWVHKEIGRSGSTRTGSLKDGSRPDGS